MIIDSFGLSLTLAAFLPFSFFLAYGIMSIPAGMIIERSGKGFPYWSLSVGLFWVRGFSSFPTYPIVLTPFAIGLGMAMLQVIILPLMREAGGEKKYAFNQVLAQIVFGTAFHEPVRLGRGAYAEINRVRIRRTTSSSVSSKG